MEENELKSAMKNLSIISKKIIEQQKNKLNYALNIMKKANDENLKKMKILFNQK